MLLPPQVGSMIHNIRILVVGAGAGGNEVLKNLVLMGFQNITIVDFDEVEDSNLSRTVLFRKKDIGHSKALTAAKRLSGMALTDNKSFIGLHGNLMTDFGKGFLFMEHDIVISCVDTLECRAYISDWCVRTCTPLFEMGFEGYNTSISFFAPDDGYEQVSDGKYIDKLPPEDGLFPIIKGLFKVCLREAIGQGGFEAKRNSCSGFKAKDEELAKIPTIQTAAAMAGTLIATELIKYLSGKDTLRNKVLFYYGLTHEMICCSYQPSDKCLIHQEHIPIEEIDIKGDPTIEEVLQAIAQKTDGFPILQHSSYIFTGKCACCGRKMDVNKLESQIFDDERWCPDCQSEYDNYQQCLNYPNEWKQTPHEITLQSDNDILSLRLKDIGVPCNEILKVLIVKDNASFPLFVWLPSYSYVPNCPGDKK